MDRVDPDRRARAFAELRRRQVLGEARELTPAERLQRVEELRAAFAHVATSGGGTDEPPELMLRLRRGGGRPT